MRQLATIQRIKSISPIKGADRIESVTFHNVAWECVIRKGQFKINDLVIYIEIDSLITEKLLKLAGLWDNVNNKGLLDGKNGDRLKTRKMKGVVSQGLVINIEVLKDY